MRQEKLFMYQQSYKSGFRLDTFFRHFNKSFQKRSSSLSSRKSDTVFGGTHDLYKEQLTYLQNILNVYLKKIALREPNSVDIP